MLYTPVPGTPLFAEHLQKRTLLDPEWNNGAEAHGQLHFAHRHPNLPPGTETDWLLRAFRRDFEVNGPSVMRMARTALRGWLRYAEDSNQRIRARVRREGERLPLDYAAALWAIRRYFRDVPSVRAKADEILTQMRGVFGLRCRLASSVGGRFVYRMIRREEKRLALGVTREPPTFYEKSANFISVPPAAAG
jgi:hypothetical protein